MTFKKFFLLQERKHFINLARFTEYVINKLEEKIAKKKNGVRSGSIFRIPMGDYGELNVKFYKGYSRRARQQLQQSWGEDNASIQAIYFPEGINENGTIEVYINTSKDYYHKDRSFEEIVDSSLPKFVKDKLRHELSHAYEDIIKDVAHHKTANYDQLHDAGMNAYENEDEEINANLNQFLTSELSLNRDIQFKISQGDINGAVRSFIAKLRTQDFIKNLEAKNKVWVLKTVYTFVRDMVEKRQGNQGLPQQ